MKMSVEDLLQLDRAFSEESQRIGVEAWSKRFMESGLMVSKNGPHLKGPIGVKEALTPLFSLKGIEFRWVPEGGGLSDDESLGYTYGHYHRQYHDDQDKIIIETGHYTTIWRRIKENEWQVELDIGN